MSFGVCACVCVVACLYMCIILVYIRQISIHKTTPFSVARKNMIERMLEHG